MAAVELFEMEAVVVVVVVVVAALPPDQSVPKHKKKYRVGKFYKNTTIKYRGPD